MNPYESPPAINPPRKFSVRLLLLLPAVLLFSFAAYEVVLQFAVYERAARMARPLPPTMFTEHLAFAIGASALALSFTVAAISKPICTSKQ